MKAWHALNDSRGYAVTAILALIAAALRIPNLNRPREFVFDETYYAKDAFSLLKFGYERAFVDKANELLLAGNENVFKDTAEYVVHPPLGKWAIAIGEALFGVNPFGWRIVMALFGILAVVLVHRIMLRLTAHPITAALAGLFMAIDGLAIVMSRTALLDQTLMLFVLLTFWAIVHDRDYYRHTLALLEYVDELPKVRALRPWRLAAIVFITCAFATKWSALWIAIAFAFLMLWWDFKARRDHGVGRTPWLADLGWLLTAAIMGTAGYVATWIGWLRSDDAWGRVATDGPAWLPQALGALVKYHQSALNFHTHLVSDHPYKAAPYWWPLMIRPTSFSYNTYDAGTGSCVGETNCSSEVLALGNIVLWWLACVVIVAIVSSALLRLGQVVVEVRGHRFGFATPARIESDVVIGPLLGFAGGWLPWIYFHNRTTFTFYSIVFAPFMFMLLAYGLTLFATRRVVECQFILVEDAEDPSQQTEVTVITREFDELHDKRFLIAALAVALAIGVTIYFLPVWTGHVMPYGSWHARMWLDSWI